MNQMRVERKRIEDFQLRVVIYARVSTQKEEQDGSVEHQISHFKEMVERNQNWSLIKIYTDRVRAESAENREQFQQMVDDAYNGEFDLILTKEVSRFARNTIDSLTYTRDLLRHGVGVFFYTDNICTVDPDSELRLTIMSSMAQDEVRKLSERVKFGHKKSIESGHVLGNSRIFGYTKVNSKLIIDEREAEMVRLIFETYATGEYGLRYIEQLLWNKGYRNRNGKKIHHNTLSGIIQNPKYKGYYCGNKVKIIDYRTKEQKFLPPDEWVIFKDESGEIVPAIVSEELWQKANVIFTERSNKVKELDRSAKKTSPLSGKIMCGVHNTPFWRTSYSHRLHKDKSIYQWICREKKRGKSCDCATIAIYESELYSILGELITRLIPNIDTYLDEFVKTYNETKAIKSVRTDVGTMESAIDVVNQKLERLTRKKDKLFDLYADDIIDKSEFKERNASLVSEIEELEKQLAEFRKKDEDTDDNVVSSVHSLKLLFHKILQKNNESCVINEDYINYFSELIIDKIIVYPVDNSSMNLEICLKVGSEEVEYKRLGRSSGHTFKKMMPKQRTIQKRKGNQFCSPNNNQMGIPLISYETNVKRELRYRQKYCLKYLITVVL